MKKTNNKGFTLIEIIVVLSIASIVMILASSLILSSMGYFDKVAVSDSDKQATDSISKFVSDELMFARGVTLTNHNETLEDDDWHYFSVVDNKLYRDGKAVYNDEFYRRRKLKIDIRGYDSYRMDLTFSFVDTKDEVIYKTRNTLELLNLKVYKDSSDEEYDPFKNISTKVKLDDAGGYRIYYQLGDLPTKNQVEVVTKGIIEDELNCLSANENIGNNRGEFAQDTLYSNGEFAYVIDTVDASADELNRIWYRFVETENNSAKSSDPLSMGGWKRIDKKWVDKSAYLIGDIIVGSDSQYYKCIKEIVGNGNTTKDKQPISGKERLFYWIKINSEDLLTSREYSKFCKNSLNRDNSSLEKEWLNCKNAQNDKGEFKKQGSGVDKVEYNAGDFVKFKDITYRAYTKTDNVRTPDENGVKEIWRKIDVNYDENRKYLATDIIYFDGLYYQALNEIAVKLTPKAKPELWSKGYDSISRLELSSEYKEVVCIIFSDDLNK